MPVWYVCEQAFCCFLLVFCLSPNFVNHARVSVSELTSFVLVPTYVLMYSECRWSWSTMGTQPCLRSAKAVDKWVWQLPDLVSASFWPSIGHTDYPCKAKVPFRPSTCHMCIVHVHVQTYIEPTYSPHTAHIQPTYNPHTAHIQPTYSLPTAYLQPTYRLDGVQSTIRSCSWQPHAWSPPNSLQP